MTSESPKSLLKWREARTRDEWYRGPREGWTRLYARKNGKFYEVQAAYLDPIHRSGGTVWWSHNGFGVNIRHKTQAEAVAWCERDAEQIAEAKKEAKKAKRNV